MVTSAIPSLLTKLASPPRAPPPTIMEVKKMEGPPKRPVKLPKYDEVEALGWMRGIERRLWFLEHKPATDKGMVYTKKVQAQGPNSLRLPIPKEIADALEIHQGDNVEICINRVWKRDDKIEE